MKYNNIESEIIRQIANICGYYQKTIIQEGNIHGYKWVDSKQNEIGTEDQLPNYLNNLNAIVKAEDTLIDENNYDHYTFLLDDIAAVRDGRGGYTATAKQRCEALLKIINRWSDSYEAIYLN